MSEGGEKRGPRSASLRAGSPHRAAKTGSSPVGMTTWGEGRDERKGQREERSPFGFAQGRLSTTQANHPTGSWMERKMLGCSGRDDRW